MGNAAINEHEIFFETDSLHLIRGNCLEVLAHMNAVHPDGFANMIFADPPYFLSNGGVTCQAGKMVSVNKGDWDKSKGPELNHAFNLEWLRSCRDALVEDGTIWISGTHHVIHSIGFAAQQLDMRIINSITWQKPNPPPNLACRCFTHSTETIFWIAKSPKSKHTFHYQDMKRENGGKQMKDVWQFTAPSKAEKEFGKHPAQKPVALLQRMILASTNPGDVVLDPFNGSGSTGVAAMQIGRQYVGIHIRWPVFAPVSNCSVKLPKDPDLFHVFQNGGLRKSYPTTFVALSGRWRIKRFFQVERDQECRDWQS